jgi:hypothetical protein
MNSIGYLLSKTATSSYIPLDKGQSLQLGAIKIQTTNIERLLNDRLEIRSLRIEKVGFRCIGDTMIIGDVRRRLKRCMWFITGTKIG